MDTRNALSRSFYLIVIISILISGLGIQSWPAQAAKPWQEEITATPAAEPDELNPYPPPPGDQPTPFPTETPVPTATPNPPADGDFPLDLPGAQLGLRINANPAIYIPGKPIRLHWNIAGFSRINLGANPQVVIQVPEGITPEDPWLAAAITADRQLVIHVVDRNDKVTWLVDGPAEWPLVFTAELWIGGELIDQEALLIDTSQHEIGPGGGAFTAMGEKVRLEVPAQAASQALVFAARQPSPHKLPPVSLTGQPVEILAAGKVTGENVTQFNQPVTIQFKYDENQIFSWAEEDLMIFYYNEADLDWYPLETVVDSENNTLRALSDHLTVFDFKAQTWQANSVPYVDSFQVAGFTGAGTYAMNFWTPPGPGGFQPQVSLSYNSQVIDEATAFTQASWVGMGWSIELGAITRNMHESNDDTTDDTFSISAGGIGGLLLPISTAGNITTYNTADQSFTKVQFDSSANTWKAWGKDGTVYGFTQTVKTNATNGCVTNINDLNLTWRWALTSITNIHSQAITYAYTHEDKPGTCLNQIAINPTTITYPNSRYRIRFVTEARTDYQTSWTTSSSRVLYSTQRLREILIEQAPSGTWSAVRKYTLTYATDSATTNVILPKFKFTQNGHVLTLLSVQESNGSGSISLPATQFTYGDSQHLTRVDNGYGGQVEMTYERWTYFDDINKNLRFLYINYENHYPNPDDKFLYECNHLTDPTPSDPPTTAWVGTYNSTYVRCGATGGDNFILQIGQDYPPPGYSIAKRSIPEHLIKPGGRYLFTLNAKAIQGTTDVYWGFYDTAQLETNAVMLEALGIDQSYHWLEDSLEMPIDYDPKTTMLRLKCNDCYINNSQFALYPVYYRVDTWTITDTITSQSATYTYHYDNASPNTSIVSAAVAAANKDPDVLYTHPQREFRGHSMTQVVNPEGLANITWYYQNDALKGKPYRTMVMEQSFYDDLETDSTNWSKSPVGAHSWGDIYGEHFDYAVRSSSTASDWSVSFTRNQYSLADGDTAIAHFRLSKINEQTNPVGEIGLTTANGKFFGLSVQPGSANLRYNTGSGTVDGSVLLSGADFKLDTWYVVMLQVDSQDGMRVLLWQLDKPETNGQATMTGFSGADWAFRERINTGSIWLDAYTEGVLHSEQSTTYDVMVQYDTDTSTTIPGLSNAKLMEYKDPAVAWTHPVEMITRNYQGSAWTGTRQVYEYEQLFGNLTGVTAFAWDGAGWVGRQSIQTRFWPKADTSKYLVSLPGSSETYTCLNASCTSQELSTGTYYLYDNKTNYSIAPDLGKLTGVRTLLREAGGQKYYSDVLYAYDPWGNRIRVTSFTGEGTATALASSGAQVSETCYGVSGQPAGCANDNYYSYPLWTDNALEQRTSWVYDYELGVITKETDPNQAEVYANYDSFGRIVSLIQPGDDSDSPTLQFEYHDAAPFWTVVYPIDGSPVRKIYDSLGRLVQTQQANVRLAQGYMDVILDTHYDALGRVELQSVPVAIERYSGSGSIYRPQTNPQGTVTTYDVLGRPLTITAPDNTSTSYAYSLDTNQNLFQTVVTDARSYATTTFTDVWGQTRKVIPPAGPGVEYEYNPAGQLITVTYGAAVTWLNYDLAGRKTQMQDADLGLWSYGYDALGNLAWQEDALHQVTCLYYDDLNRLEGKNYQSAPGCPSNPVTYSVAYLYDQSTSTNSGVGRRTGMSDASGSTSWEYDLRGRLIHEAKTVLDGALDLGTYHTYWSYNSDDTVRQMVYPNQETLNFDYLPQGALSQVYTIQEDGLSNVHYRYSSAAAYDAAGRLTSQMLGNGVQQTFAYNLWNVDGGRLESASAQKPGSPTLQDFSYSYDPNGNIDSIMDGVANEYLMYYYDPLNRLDEVSGTYYENPEYDPASGNLSERNGLDYSYADLTHPHAVTSTSDGRAFVYDANGNMTSRNIPAGTFTLVYDAENRLTEITGSGLTARYVYDGDGSRVLAVVNGVRTVYIGDYFEAEMSAEAAFPVQFPELVNYPLYHDDRCFQSFLPLAMSSGGGTPPVGMISGNFGDTYYHTHPAAPVQAGITYRTYYYFGGRRTAVRLITNTADGLYYLLTDHLGSTNKVLDDAGNQVGEQHYGAWGESHYANGEMPTDRKYTSQLEAEAGLYFYNSRWYDAALSRWAQPDTLVPYPHTSMSWDHYAYSRNNPVNWVDPSGHMESCGDPGMCEGTFDPRFLIFQKNQWLGQQDIDDLDAFVQLVEYAASLTPECPSCFVENLGSVITGLSSGDAAFREMMHRIDAVHYPYDSFYEKATKFEQSGYADAFQDPHPEETGANQAHHLWFYAQIGFESGNFIGISVNLIHETLWPPTPAGKSFQDLSLGYEGLELGIMLREGIIAPEEVGDYIMMTMSPGSPEAEYWNWYWNAALEAFNHSIATP